MKKRVVGFGVALLLIFGVIGAATNSSSNSDLIQSSNESSAQPVDASTPATSDSADSIDNSAPAASSDTIDTGATDTNLSNDNTYTNVDGTTVHSPAYSTDGSVPAEATAQCVDGSYSFSQHASGTCSHHGGVAQWL